MSIPMHYESAAAIHPPVLKRPAIGERTCAALTELVLRGANGFLRRMCGGYVEGTEHVLPLLRDGFVLASNHVRYLASMVLWEHFLGLPVLLVGRRTIHSAWPR